jgi:hypothetical protein
LLWPTYRAYTALAVQFVPGNERGELMISVIGPIATESPEARFWAVLRETIPCGLFGFGRTVPGRVFGPCERVGATRQEQGPEGRRFAYSWMRWKGA